MGRFAVVISHIYTCVLDILSHVGLSRFRWFMLFGSGGGSSCSIVVYCVTFMTSNCFSLVVIHTCAYLLAYAALPVK